MTPDPAVALADLIEKFDAWIAREPGAHERVGEALRMARAALAAASSPASEAGSGAGDEVIERAARAVGVALGFHQWDEPDKYFGNRKDAARAAARAVLAAASPPEVEDGSGAGDEWVCDWCGAPDDPNEDAIEHITTLRHDNAALRAQIAVLAAAQPAPVSPESTGGEVNRAAEVPAIEWALFVDHDGGLVPDESSLPVGELRRLLREEWADKHAQPAPSEPPAVDAAEVLDGLIAEMRALWDKENEQSSGMSYRANMHFFQGSGVGKCIALVEAALRRVEGTEK